MKLIRMMQRFARSAGQQKIRMCCCSAVATTESEAFATLLTIRTVLGWNPCQKEIGSARGVFS